MLCWIHLSEIILLEVDTRDSSDLVRAITIAINRPFSCCEISRAISRVNHNTATNRSIAAPDNTCLSTMEDCSQIFQVLPLQVVTQKMSGRPSNAVHATA